MRGRFLLYILINITTSGYASIAINKSSVKQFASVFYATDTTIGMPSGITDSLAQYRSRLDSIAGSFTNDIEKTRSWYKGYSAKINRKEQELTSLLDSLNRLGKPTAALTSKLDSIRSRLTQVHEEGKTKIEQIRTKAMSALDVEGLPPELQKEVGALKDAIAKVNPLSASPGMMNVQSALNTARLPALDINTASLPSIDAGKLSQSLPGVSDLPTGNQALDVTKQLNPNNLVSTDKLTNEIGVSGISAGDIQSLDGTAIDQLAESKLTGYAPVGEIQKQTNIPYSETLKSEDALKSEMINQVRTAAVNHFAGQQEQLQAAMDQISKYKTKFKSVPNIRDLTDSLKKVLTRPAEGKRFVFGFNIEIQGEGEILLLDFNPYVGYKITRQITAGLGWNQRWGYDRSVDTFNSSSRIFGPRAYGEYLIGKGFSPRFEIEVMNTTVPPLTMTKGDPNSRRWVYGMFAGIKKQYKLLGRVNGTATVMFRLVDPRDQSPYKDVVSARFGFEFPQGSSKRPKK
ncbi:hypothetical protein WBG78_04935 [Chryseolinea sp. T2]|uniref:hypothetical protein n=1 Tax=Chryseolinea sp. T2 TaxID=3129255 RepID=UPI003077BA2D